MSETVTSDSRATALQIIYQRQMTINFEKIWLFGSIMFHPFGKLPGTEEHAKPDSAPRKGKEMPSMC